MAPEALETIRSAEMTDPVAFFALPPRPELSTRRCDLSCDYCRHCQPREIPAADLERVLARPTGGEPRAFRIRGGDPFLQGEIDRFVGWARGTPGSLASVEGPAATLAGPRSDEAVARLVHAKPDAVAAVLPTIERSQTARFTGRTWDPARALDTLARLAEAGLLVEVVFPVNAQTVPGLAQVVLRAAERLGSRGNVTLRRMPVVRRGSVALPLIGAERAWDELPALSAQVESLPSGLPGGARLHLDKHAGYAPCMLSPQARRPDLVHPPGRYHQPARPLGETCDRCAWSASCTFEPLVGRPAPELVRPLANEEALALQEDSGASVLTHRPKAFRTNRSALGLPELLCLAPWTTLSTTEPRFHPVPCALSWVDTQLSAAEIVAETGEDEAEVTRHLFEAQERFRGFWYVWDNEAFSVLELWNSPLLRRMRREMAGGAKSSRCRAMCRVVMGVEERGLEYFRPADQDLPRALAGNRRLLLEEIHAGKAVLTAKPLELMASASANCNIECGFCDGPKGATGDISDRRRDEIVELLPTLMSLGASGLGEPLMGKNYLFLLGHIADHGYPGLSVSLTTNGTLLTPEFLERHRNVPWSHVRISLNAGSAATHERVTGKQLFERVRRNLDALCALRDRRDNRFQVTLSCVLGSLQMGDLSRFALLVHDHQTDIVVEPMYGDMHELSPWTRPERLKVLAEELGSVAAEYELKNPPISRAFRAVETFARDRLAGTDFGALAHH